MQFLRRVNKVFRPLTRGEVIAVAGKRFEPAIVITGGSEGLGRAFAKLLAEDAVLMISRDENALAEAAAEILAVRPESKVRTLALDVTKDSAPRAVREYLVKTGLYADIVINNAGAGLGGRFDTQERTDVLRVVDLNVRALVAMTHEFLPDMRERGAGGVLNLASVAGFMPGPWQALYFASKSFVLSFSQAIAAETHGSGVLIMAAAPGPVETGIHRSMLARWTWYRALFPSYTPDVCAKMIWEGFTSGHRVFIPGVINNVSALAAKLVPPEIMIPFVAWLVRPRYRNGATLD
jgi:uncharacterized protein